MARAAQESARRAFRDAVLGRAGGRCCVPGCDRDAVDAHHLIERRLWPDGGYVADNGAALCAAHHVDAEATRVRVEDLRAWSGVTRVVVPPGWDQTVRYDKWGNEILADGRRLAGPLADDPAMRRILDRSVTFADRVKYPRTPHLPYSPGRTDDDVVVSAASFSRLPVVVTEKLDGENTTIYAGGATHARSVDAASRPWQTWVRNFAAGIGTDIPEGWRVCGENLYARHSIAYTDLESWFAGFAIFDDTNRCLAWDDTLEWFALLGVVPVPVVWRGVFDASAIHTAWEAATAGRVSEGYVVRDAGSFPYAQFAGSVAKWVRAGHVTTDEHWTTSQIVPNGLRGGN